MTAKLLTSQLFLKLELMLNETCKTSTLKNAAKILMNLSSSLMKVKYNREMFPHESFRKPFRKS